nr:insulinase family protein [Planctomycetota bacterium]
TVEGITEYRLDNGLQVLLFPDASKPTVTVNITYLVGSRHEGYGEAGMAHLLEHLLFKGTPTHPDIPGVLRNRGAQMNGSTSFDRTNYFETLPAEGDNLEFALRLEADRMVNSYVRKEDLDSEMTVVRNEFEAGENNPTRILQQRVFSVAFDWHNYGKSTIGNRADIERVPIDKLKAFYRRYYQPDNAVLIVAGQFDQGKGLQLIQKYFGAIPKPERELDNTYTEEPSADGERIVMLRRVGEVSAVSVAYRMPAGPHVDFPSIDVMSDILTNVPSGRLYKALVESKKATSVGGGAPSLHDPGLLMIMAQVRADGSPEEVEQVIIKELEGLAEKGVTEAEVSRGREKYLKQYELLMTNTSSVGIALSSAVAMGDWRLFFLDRDRMAEVTPKSVADVAARYLVRNNRIVGRFVPTDEPQRVAVPPRPDVSAMLKDYKGREEVAAGEDFDPTPENIEARTTRETLPSGIKLAMLPKRTRGEVVQLTLRLHYGNAESLKGLETAASVLPTLMTKGTKQLSQQQIKDALDKRRSTLRGSGSAGTITFTIQTKRAELAAVLALLRQILREPSLPAEELEIYRRQRLAMLEQISTRPQFLAMERVGRAMSPYPKGDVRYEPTLQDRIERYESIKMDQVKRLYDDFLGGANGEAAVVGDFDPDEVRPLLAAMLDGWAAKVPYKRIDNRAGTELPAIDETIQTPDMANAAYAAGLAIAMDAFDPDFPAMVIGNQVLGASAIDSRLGDRIRKKEGLSYSVGSTFSANPIDPVATFQVQAISNPQNVPKLRAIVREELDRLLRDGITDEELADAKKKKLHSWHMQWTSDSNLASSLASALQTGRTMLYRAEHRKAVEALTAGQVVEALRKHLDLDRLSVVTAGDFEAKKEPKAAAVR